MDLSPNHASVDGISRLSVDSINWLGENMLKPLYNSGVVEPERAVASTVKAIAGLNLPMLELQNVQQAQPWTAAWCTQAVSNAAGMTLPYLLSGKLASGVLGTGGRLAVSEGVTGTLLSRQATAQILGATAYDAMRAPTEHQSRVTNATAGAVSFGTFELGNSIAARSHPLVGTAVRLAAGFAGGSSHQLISEGSNATRSTIMQTGVSGAALNSLLPLAGRAFSRASEELQFVQRPELRKMLANLPAETGTGANRWIGWVSENDPRFRLSGDKAQGHPIPELPMRGTIETANLGIADFNMAQRKGIYLKLERGANPQLAESARISSLVDHVYDGTKHWGSTPSTDGAIFKTQAADIAAGVNKFAHENGLTRITVEVADQPGFLAAYGPGSGNLKVGSAGFAEGTLTPKVVEKVAHEYTHALQDARILRMLADKHGVGMKPTDAQIKSISAEYMAHTNSPLKESFLSQVMTDRTGVRLSFSETLHAKQLINSMKLYAAESPLANRGAMDLTLSQIDQSVAVLEHPEGLAILRDAIKDGGGPMLDMIRGNVPYAKHLGTAPNKLLGLGKMLQQGEDAITAPAVQSVLLDVALGLQGMRQVGQSRYLRFFFEKEAMSSGSLAKIHAVSKSSQVLK